MEYICILLLKGYNFMRDLAANLCIYNMNHVFDLISLWKHSQLYILSSHD